MRNSRRSVALSSRFAERKGETAREAKTDGARRPKEIFEEKQKKRKEKKKKRKRNWMHGKRSTTHGYVSNTATSSIQLSGGKTDRNIPARCL